MPGGFRRSADDEQPRSWIGDLLGCRARGVPRPKGEWTRTQPCLDGRERLSLACGPQGGVFRSEWWAADHRPAQKVISESLKREQQLSEVAPARQPPTCLRRRDACCVDIPEPVLAVPSGAEKSLRFFFFGDRDSKVQATVYDMPGRDVVVLRRRIPVRAGSARGWSARFPKDVPGGSFFSGAFDHTADASTRCRIGESHHQIGGAGIGQQIERTVPQNGSVDDEYFFVHSLTELDLAAGGTQFLDPFSVTIGPDSITLFVDGPRVDDDPYTCPHAFSEHCRPLLHRTWIEEGAIEFDVRGRSSDVPSHRSEERRVGKECSYGES